MSFQCFALGWMCLFSIGMGIGYGLYGYSHWLDEEHPHSNASQPAPAPAAFTNFAPVDLTTGKPPVASTALQAQAPVVSGKSAHLWARIKGVVRIPSR